MYLRAVGRGQGRPARGSQVRVPEAYSGTGGHVAQESFSVL